ncbi:MAG: glycosyltransferase [Candidatus Omnitrophota bacterium]|nr:MAG: glycosyltransferase [Candidatus Omnitrophota bacterium]
MTKILYLYETLNLGGAEQLFLTTLKRLDRTRFHPVVCCIGQKGEIGKEIEEMGITVKSLNKKTYLRGIPVIYDLIRIFREEKPHIVHTHLFFANIYGRIASKIAGIKTIITTLHNPDYTYEDNGRWTFKIRKIIDKYSGKICNTAFIAVSDYVKQDFEKQLGFRNIKVLHNCIDSSRFKKPDTGMVREKRNVLGLENDDIVILNTGRLHPQKGQIYLIEAFNLIRKDNQRYKLLIIGKGTIEAELKKKVNDLGLGDSVIFLKDRKDVPEIMSACDIFVFPSLYEGFGIALVEAMASSMPVVASDIAPLREIARNNTEAILVEKENHRMLAQAISELMANKEKRAYLGENARKRAIAAFDASIHVRNLENIYQELIHDRCIVCDGRAFAHTIYGGYRYENRIYSIVKCSGCGFMFLNPLPTKETLDNIYKGDDYFDNYYATASGIKSYTEAMADSAGCDKDVIGIIKKYKESGRLLDVGCAGGHFLTNARSSGFEVSGVEPNQKMAEYARDALRLNVVCGTLEDIKFDENCFDVIHAGDVLEHIPALKKNIEIIKGLLADEGILIVNQPLMYNKSLFNLFLKTNMLLKKNRYSLNPPSHLWEFNSITLKTFLKNMGFEIVYYRISEARAKPLAIYEKPTIRNTLGYHMKNLSSVISNSPALERFKIGDRAIVVCRKRCQI